MQETRIKLHDEYQHNLHDELKYNLNEVRFAASWAMHQSTLTDRHGFFIESVACGADDAPLP